MSSLANILVSGLFISLQIWPKLLGQMKDTVFTMKYITFAGFFKI